MITFTSLWFLTWFRKCCLGSVESFRKLVIGYRSVNYYTVTGHFSPQLQNVRHFGMTSQLAEDSYSLISSSSIANGLDTSNGACWLLTHFYIIYIQRVCQKVVFHKPAYMSAINPETTMQETEMRVPVDVYQPQKYIAHSFNNA